MNEQFPGELIKQIDARIFEDLITSTKRHLPNFIKNSLLNTESLIPVSSVCVSKPSMYELSGKPYD